MPRTVPDPRLNVPLRNAKAELDSVQKLTGGAGEVLDLARANVQMEPKQMAAETGISHSLVLRGLKTGEMNFERLWRLDDAYWRELLFAVATKRRIGTLRRTLDFDERAG